jgi:hypothetical protein
MSATPNRAEGYATESQLGELFERTSQWLTLHGEKHGSRMLGQAVMLDGSVIYAENELGDVDGIEKFEFDVSELVARKLQTSRFIGQTLASVSVEYVPEHYVFSGPEHPLDYTPSTCLFRTVSSMPPTEEVLFIQKESSEASYSSSRYTLGHQDEVDDAYQVTGADEIFRNFELEQMMGTLCMTAEEYYELSKVLSLLERLKFSV